MRARSCPGVSTTVIQPRTAHRVLPLCPRPSDEVCLHRISVRRGARCSRPANCSGERTRRHSDDPKKPDQAPHARPIPAPSDTIKAEAGASCTRSRREAPVASSGLVAGQVQFDALGRGLTPEQRNQCLGRLGNIILKRYQDADWTGSVRGAEGITGDLTQVVPGLLPKKPERFRGAVQWPGARNYDINAAIVPDAHDVKTGRGFQ